MLFPKITILSKILSQTGIDIYTSWMEFSNMCATAINNVASDNIFYINCSLVKPQKLWVLGSKKTLP